MDTALAHLREYCIPQNCTCAHEHEEDEVNEEENDRHDFEHIAIVVIREIVKQGGHDAGPHDYT